MPAKRKPPAAAYLALQGGGTHAAFAWGALERLLAQELSIQGITASSTGALQAVILAEGFRLGGHAHAISHLETFWRKVSVAASLLPIRTGPFDRLLSEIGIDFSPSTVAMDYVTRLFSPYQFNLFDFNPVRGIVEEMVDFASLRKKPPFPLFINATHAGTGESRVFYEEELTLEMVMASSCLPYLFKTVEVEGEPYWDGGYSGNPPLAPLLSAHNPCDILLLETIPRVSEEVPTRAPDILDRATEISFNATLALELKLLEAHNTRFPEGSATLHRIEAEAEFFTLGRASKLNADWDFLRYLHDLGWQAVEEWK